MIGRKRHHCHKQVTEYETGNDLRQSFLELREKMGPQEGSPNFMIFTSAYFPGEKIHSFYQILKWVCLYSSGQTRIMLSNKQPQISLAKHLSLSLYLSPTPLWPR